MEIGNHVTIGANSVVEAATIGNGVEIGKNCIIVSPPPLSLPIPPAVQLTRDLTAQGSLSIIHEYSKIHDGAVLGPRTIVPSLTEWAGNPGTFPSLRSEASAACINLPSHETGLTNDRKIPVLIFVRISSFSATDRKPARVDAGAGGEQGEGVLQPLQPEQLTAACRISKALEAT